MNWEHKIETVMVPLYKTEKCQADKRHSQKEKKWIVIIGSGGLSLASHLTRILADKR